MPAFVSSREKRNFKSLAIKLVKIIAIFIVVALPVMGIKALTNKPKLVADNNVSPTQPAIQGALASVLVNQEILIPLTTKEGGENLIYRVESVEKRNQILVQGKLQTAVAGRLFLILNVKLTNNLDQGIEINTKDYVRLKVNGSEELLAPDIHNDPVEVQAISTKYTRIGFPIYDTDKQFVLRMGEIKGDKVEIPLEI